MEGPLIMKAWWHHLTKYRRRASWQLRSDHSAQFTGARARAWLVTRAAYVADAALGHETGHDHQEEPWLIA